ncbi:adenosylcobinamide-GDP ribazoletransferase [Candidatus Electronema sp. PJ]|uniref:adenosylcobinamide-GDP ribazoletransferase n=1 Tax=Candidatus Electronema sp. PJ TaxID=3401572 RepID=UPI003AA9D458
MNRWRKNRHRKAVEETPPPQSGGEQEPLVRLRLPSFTLLFRPFGYFAAALRFLTIMPLPGKIGTTEEELAHAVLFFPLVGLLLGCVAVLAAKMLFLFLPPLPAAILTTFVLLAFSGGLHLDGLADTADGFFSARTSERMLEIMKDSSIGTMGAIALVLLLLLKATCLASLTDQLLPAVFLMPIAGRAAILLLMAMLPYVREEGLGRLFAAYFNSGAAWAASLLGFLLLTWAAYAAAGPQGMAAVLATLLQTFLFAFFCRCKIGGATGDTLGAACELAEVAAALAFTLKI